MSKPPKILWFELRDLYTTRRIKEAAHRLGMHVDALEASDLSFTAGPRGAGVFHRGRNIVSDYDGVIVRSFLSCMEEAVTIARLFREAGKVVVDESMADRSYVAGKMHDYIALASKGIAVPQTQQIFDTKTAGEMARKFGFPCVVKGVHGAEGNHVHKVESFTQLQKCLRQYKPGEAMLQEFLPAEVDFRVNVIGYTALPVYMIRKPPTGEFRTRADFALACPISEAPHLREIAEKSARILRREFCGVDIRCRGEKPFVLEVNRRPGFKGYEIATDYDTAQHLLMYVAKKCGYTKIDLATRLAELSRQSISSKIFCTTYNATPRLYVEFRDAILPAPGKRWGGAAFKDDAFFLQSAEAEAHRLIERLRCTKSTRLLDVGCGPGRLPIGLLRVMGDANYFGIDVHSGSIEWCKKFIQRLHPSFRFQHVNARNERYNPEGTKLDGNFRLHSTRSGSVDVIYSFDVFSHMEERDVRIYLEEFSRVLTRKGKIFFTAFVEENVPPVSINPTNYVFKEIHGPLHCVRFEQQHLFNLIDQAGFAIDEFMHGAEIDSQSAFYLRKK